MSAAALAHLKRQYPSPPPDPTWVSDCVSALLADGQPATPETVEAQYLWSNLGGSAGASIPTGDTHARVLFPTPTLLQIHTLSEIGASAVALKTALEQRRDVISGATRIRRLGEAGEDEPDEQHKGPPAYPRAMLAMDVSDGRTALRAIEYRRIPGLTLGVTPLGTKLLLHNVRCLRGTLLLEPSNTTVVGGSIEPLEAEQPASFVAGLEARIEAARAGTAGQGTVTGSSGARRRRTMPLSGPGSGSTSARAAQPPAARATRSRTSGEARRARLAAIQAAMPVDLTHDTSVDDFDAFDYDDSFIRSVDAAEAGARQVEVIELLSD